MSNHTCPIETCEECAKSTEVESLQRSLRTLQEDLRFSKDREKEDWDAIVSRDKAIQELEAERDALLLENCEGCLKDKIRDLTDENARLEADNRGLEEKAGAADANLDFANAEVRRLVDRNKGLVEQLTYMEADRDRWCVMAERRLSKVQELEARLADINGTYYPSRERDYIIKENARLGEVIHRAEGKIRELEGFIKDQNVILGHSRDERLAAEETIKLLNKEADFSIKEINKIECARGEAVRKCLRLETEIRVIGNGLLSLARD